MNLNDEIKPHFKLGDKHNKALHKLKIKTIRDLLFFFPNHYGESFEQLKIGNILAGAKVTTYGQIDHLEIGKTFHGRKPIAKGSIFDETGKLNLIWFSQPYIAKMFKVGDLVRIEGIVSNKKTGNHFSVANPKIEKVSDIPIGQSGTLFANNQTTLHPTYSESKGITSNWFFYAIQKIFKSGILDQIEESIPEEILKKYNLPQIKTALIWIHNPKKESDAISARKRFAFEEIFYIQIQKQIQRFETKKLKAFKIKSNSKEIKKFTDNYPFKLTTAQDLAIKTILDDMQKDFPMSRLLEGDVGSGKTAVAAATVSAVTNNKPFNQKTGEKQNFGHLQTAYMVPTEILAKQHFENFINYFKKKENQKGIQIGLLTGSACYKFPSKVDSSVPTKISKTQLIKWIESGEIPILIGTHALIQKNVKFKNLGLVIIDEQHRFGTDQRKKLAQKEGFAPHLLSMTATPIPRTLSLTIYGDLDLTILDQMPTGRKPIITEIVPPTKRDETYNKIREEIKNGRQAYIICPRIDEPDQNKINALYAKSVKAEATRLKKKIFSEMNIDILHSKMTTKEKDEVMKKFEIGKTDILVATSVVEVGVNVPNATIMVIEGAERFGLAQLHQLRGRVIRSNFQAYCYIFTDSKSDTSIKRLQALKTAKNGFELAELDLSLRGSGELVGRKQWGISDIGMEAIKNIKMVEAAQIEAKYIVEKDPKLEIYKTIAEKIKNKEKIHFE
ncbi:MAG TPA: ATP-dependent DNA helicase RecG [Candidatus Paceibacterota bacterium]|nr:ATP-dependent DNA helicase RecG [Candidatus Paceibacterota bacterium]HMP19288.1 ATP-dependent DNA helicase RecG [Candidatus Paceibacterota bacterium]HMP85526.1 ATP-dependent DNA helicase RecG [Candidatus Paceibacterota bacterium]